MLKLRANCTVTMIRLFPFSIWLREQSFGADRFSTLFITLKKKKTAFDLLHLIKRVNGYNKMINIVYFMKTISPNGSLIMEKSFNKYIT